MEIVLGLDGCLHRTQLNLALLGDRRDTGGQAAAQGNQHILDRRDAVVLRGERKRMVDVIGERRLVLLLLAEPVEGVHARAAVRAAHPGNCCAPLELCDLGCRRPRRSRTPSRASTLTPLSTGVCVVVMKLLHSLVISGSGPQREAVPQCSTGRLVRTWGTCLNFRGFSWSRRAANTVSWSATVWPRRCRSAAAAQICSTVPVGA